MNGAASASASAGAQGAISQMQEQQEPTDLKSYTTYVDESQIYQKGSWNAHTDVIKSIQYIPLTVEPLVMTASAD